MVRDIVSASLFGTTRVWDAFVFAFMIPNLLRRLVSEGALSSIFVPLYAEVKEKQGEQEAELFARQVGSLFLIAALSLCVIFYSLISVFHLFFVFPPKWLFAIQFLSILFPYVVFILLVSVGIGVLYSDKSFLFPALSPILMNVVWIIAVLIVCPFLSKDLLIQGRILCVAVVFSGFIQGLLIWFPLRGRGHSFKLILKGWIEPTKKYMQWLIPAVLGISVLHINLWADFVFGFFLQEGMTSSLWYASRLMLFPMSIFTLGLSTVLLPEYAQSATKKDYKQLGDTLSFSLRMMSVIIIPASVGLILLAYPIIKVIFERGEFTDVSTAQTQLILCGYSLGLFFFSCTQVLVGAFLGMKDIKTPLRVGLLCIGVHLFLNYFFLNAWGTLGLALSTSLCGFLNFVLLFLAIRKRIEGLQLSVIINVFFKVGVVSLLMGVFVYWIYDMFKIQLWGTLILNELTHLFSIILMAVFFYFILCFLFRIHEVRSVWKWILKKK